MKAKQESKQKVLISPVLMYCDFHRHNSSKANIVKVTASDFYDEELVEAKSMLWETFGLFEFLGEHHDGQDSANRISKEANVEDILKALTDLDEHNVNATFVTDMCTGYPKVAQKV